MLSKPTQKDEETTETKSLAPTHSTNKHTSNSNISSSSIFARSNEKSAFSCTFYTIILLVHLWLMNIIKRKVRYLRGGIMKSMKRFIQINCVLKQTGTEKRPTFFTKKRQIKTISIVVPMLILLFGTSISSSSIYASFKRI